MCMFYLLLIFYLRYRIPIDLDEVTFTMHASIRLNTNDIHVVIAQGDIGYASVSSEYLLSIARSKRNNNLKCISLNLVT